MGLQRYTNTTINSAIEAGITTIQKWYRMVDEIGQPLSDQIYHQRYRDNGGSGL
jgi:hypothetical protein